MFVLSEQSKQKWLVLQWKRSFKTRDAAKEKANELINHRGRDKVEAKVRPLAKVPLLNLLIVPKAKILGSVLNSQLPNSLFLFNLTSSEVFKRINARGKGRLVRRKMPLLPFGLVLCH